jgi:chromosome segregation ATPase
LEDTIPSEHTTVEDVQEHRTQHLKAMHAAVANAQQAAQSAILSHETELSEFKDMLSQVLSSLYKEKSKRESMETLVAELSLQVSLLKTPLADQIKDREAHTSKSRPKSSLAAHVDKYQTKCDEKAERVRKCVAVVKQGAQHLIQAAQQLEGAETGGAC